MRLLEEFTGDFLAHMYDPIDRHERYLRERDLKGRRPAAAKPVVTRKPGALHPAVSRTKKPVALPAKKAPPKKTAAQRNAEIHAQVEALKVKLEKLREVLRQLVDEAQARSGQEPTKNTPDKKLTPSEKKKKAAAQKKYDDKHKNDPPTASEELKSVQTKIKNVQNKIKEMRAKLAEAAKKNQVTTQPVRKPVPVGDRRQTLTKKGDSQNGSRSR